ncbi:hypothetical protein [Paraburkholderia atlantica]|uniref:hypothetical protein n=1 Tax=Paraburkholderia atlantica TaxID=2654982 RepID=UPI00037EBD18|nr:hypothetical protein [Paraburkholderia atlantica]
MQKIRKVAFTCDFLRVTFNKGKVGNSQYRNLDWLVRIVDGDAFSRKWGVETEVVLPPLEQQSFGHLCENDALCVQYAAASEETWAALYDGEDLPVFGGTLGRLLVNDLIVGFELPPVLKRVLNRAGKKYLSIHIHPTRFLGDLCFFTTTNCTEISATLSAFPDPERESSTRARRLRALLSRRRAPAFGIPNGLPVLIGQTRHDAVLIDQGRFASLTDFRTQIEASLQNYGDVIFLEHPYESQNGASVEFLRSELGKSVISLRTNAYGVIFSPADIPCVLTLSSSLGHEATFAGRPSEFLLSSPLDKFVVPGVDQSKGVAIGHGLLTDSFWSRVLHDNLPRAGFADDEEMNPFVLGDDFLRSSLETWAYRDLDARNFVATARKRLIPSVSAAKTHYTGLLDSIVGDEDSLTVDDAKIQSCVTRWGSVEFVPRPIAAGEKLEFAFGELAVEQYFHDGFHSPEDWGIWSRAKRASIGIPIANNDARELRVNFKISVQVLPELLKHAPVLVIDVDGTETAIVLFRQSGENQQTLSFHATTRRRLCMIGFKCTHSGSPRDLSESSDSRVLAFAVSSFMCSVDASGRSDESGPTRSPSIFGLPFAGGASNTPVTGAASDAK